MLFTRDLRVRDNPALAGACARASAVLPLFVVDPALAVPPNRARFLAESLAVLREELRGLGGDLVIRQGDPVAVAVRLATRVQAEAVSSPTTCPGTRRGAPCGSHGSAQGTGWRSRSPPATRSCPRENSARRAATTTGSSRRTGAPGRPPRGGGRMRCPRPSRSRRASSLASCLPPGRAARRASRRAGSGRAWTGSTAGWTGRRRSYAARRDDLAADGTSRLSALPAVRLRVTA